MLITGLNDQGHSFSIKNREFLLKVVCKRKINSTPPFALFVTFFQPCVQCCCLDLIEEHSMKKMLMKKCFLSFSFSRLCLFTSHWIELIFPNLLRKMKVVGMGRVKTQPEIWPDPMPFWPTRPNPNYNFENPSNPRYNFVQPDCNLTCTAPPFCQWFLHALLHHPELGQNWLKNEKKTWPEFDPNQILLTRAQKSLTRDPTRARSQNPKPDPRPEKRTRPIPTM